MKAAVFLFFLIVAGALAAGSAGAAMLGDADVAFSADRTVTVNGQVFRGKLFHTPGRERHEQDLVGREIFILDVQTERGWVVVPSLKTYVEFPFPPAMAALGSPDLTRSAVRKETVNGVRTTKYRIEHRVEDTLATGFAPAEFEDYVIEEQVPHSTALHAGWPDVAAPDRPDCPIHPQQPVAVPAGTAGGRRGGPRRRMPQPLPQYPRPRRRGGLRGG